MSDLAEPWDQNDAAIEELSNWVVSLLEARTANSRAAMQLLCLVKYRFAGCCKGRELAVVAEYDETDVLCREGFDLAAAVGFDGSKLTGGGSA